MASQLNYPNNRAYGLQNALQNMAPEPVVSTRNPGDNDIGEIGTIWVNKGTNAYWVLAGYSAGVPQWAAQGNGGSTTLTDLTITGGAGTVLTVDAGGSVEIAGGDFTMTGNASVTGNLAVTGDVTVTGDFDITDTSAISLTSTADAADAIYLHADGGTSETIRLHSDQGTGVGSVTLLSDVGGLTLRAAGLASADAINLEAAAGGIDIDAALQINIASTQNAADSIVISSTNGGIDIITAGAAAGEDIDITATGSSVNITATENVADSIVISSTNGGIDITCAGASAGEDIDITANGSSVNITATEDVARAIYLRANAGTSETIQLHSDQGTGVGSVNLLSDVGGITLTATGLASADAINLEATAGGIDVDAALQINIASAQNAADAIVINASAGGIDITAAGAATEDIDIVNTAGSVNISAGENAADAITIAAGAGGIDITATGTAGEDIDITASGSSVNVTATEDAALAIYLRANGGTSETIRVHADQGTGVGSINLLSDVGGITLTATGLASADAINLEATAGGIDADAALQINIASSQNAADAIVINASAGGIDITAAGAAAEDLDLTCTAGSVNITAGESAADSIVISSTIGGIDILATGAAAGEDIDITASSSINITSTEDTAQAIYIRENAGTSGGIDIHADQGTANTSINIHSDAGGITIASGGSGDILIDSDDTLLLDSDGVLELNSSAGVISIGNDNVNQNMNIGTAGQRTIQMGNATAGTVVYILGPDNVGVTLQNSVRLMTGAGSPNGAVTAPAGSLWLRTDPAGATSRIYVNTDSGTTWTNVTCAA